MKTLQLGVGIVNPEWHYRYCIFEDEENGTEVHPITGVVKCKSHARQDITETLVDKYKTAYNAKEVYVSTNGQGTKRA